MPRHNTRREFQRRESALERRLANLEHYARGEYEGMRNKDRKKSVEICKGDIAALERKLQRRAYAA